MGYPNPHESDYDLFMTGHAGSSVCDGLAACGAATTCSASTSRKAVAVIGDGAFPSGIVFEALNNIGGLKQDLLVVLNDNKMSICPRVGGVASYLDRLRTSPFYSGLKHEVVRVLENVPLLGDPVERFLAQLKEGVKAGLHGGMLFEELGFRYLGPIDGHNIADPPQIPADGEGPQGSDPAARRHRERARLHARRARPGLLPHAARLHAGERLPGAEEGGRQPGLHERRQRRDPRADAQAIRA